MDSNERELFLKKKNFIKVAVFTNGPWSLYPGNNWLPVCSTQVDKRPPGG